MYPEKLIKFDIHSHVLPGIDDGSSSSVESVAMLEKLFADGVDAVVAAPHFYPWEDEPDAFFERRESSGARLVHVMRKNSDKRFPTIFVGAEVGFYRGISKYWDLPKLCIMGTDHILIEMPFEKWSRIMVDEVVSIKRVRGITPIIAHIERYFSFMDEGMLDALIDGGCVIQCNAEPLLRFFAGRKVLDLIRRGKIHVLGSDAHNMSSRVPRISEAARVIKDRLGEKRIAAFNQNASEILAGAVDLCELVDKEML